MADFDASDRLMPPRQERSLPAYLWQSLGIGLPALAAGVALVAYLSLAPAAKAEQFQHGGTGRQPVPAVLAGALPSGRVRPEARDPIVLSDRESDGGVLFDHNGSDVLFFADKGLIVYTRPRPGMRSVVASGDVLFRGTIRDHVLTGRAYAFKAGCRPAAYDVRGVLSDELDGEAARLHLQGAAPLWDRASCRVVASTYDAPSASLGFRQLMGVDLEARVPGPDE